MFIDFQVNDKSNSLKYIQLVDAIANSISEGSLAEGDMLPSVNDLIKTASISRDTIFKAYSELKNRGLVVSVPNRGYFITRQLNRVLLFLDTFKAYKEVLYDGFRSNLPETFSVDLVFHHYNFKIFESIVNDSIGKYSHYVIMNFDHPGVNEAISKIPADKLLVIDWNIHTAKEHSFVCQDFGKAVYANLETALDKIKTYKRFVFHYPKAMTYHPKVSVANFKKFCNDYGLKHEVVYDLQKLTIEKGDLFFLVSDRTLARILDHAHERNLKLGDDIGIISYNDTPMKKYVKDGITVLSTNFYQMGKLAAEYVLNPGEMKQIVPTELIIRKSF
jgi:DNA-binding transcriptional regulator YhcF (GntR family)